MLFVWKYNLNFYLNSWETYCRFEAMVVLFKHYQKKGFAMPVILCRLYPLSRLLLPLNATGCPIRFAGLQLKYALYQCFVQQRMFYNHQDRVDYRLIEGSLLSIAFSVFRVLSPLHAILQFHQLLSIFKEVRQTLTTNFYYVLNYVF